MKVSQAIAMLQKSSLESELVVLGKNGPYEPICIFGSNGPLTILSIQCDWQEDYEYRKSVVNQTIEEMAIWKRKGLKYLKSKITIEKFFVITSYVQNEINLSETKYYADSQLAFEEYEHKEALLFHEDNGFTARSIRFSELDLPWNKDRYNDLVKYCRKVKYDKHQIELYVFNQFMLNSEMIHLSRCDQNTFMS